MNRTACRFPVHAQFATPGPVGDRWAAAAAARDRAGRTSGLPASRTHEEDGAHFLHPSGPTAGTRAAHLPLPAFERFSAGRGRGVSLPVRRERGARAAFVTAASPVRVVRPGTGC